MSEFAARELGDLAPSAAETKVQTFEVDGATVLTRTNLEVLPDQACVVRFATNLTDSGDGFRLCIGAMTNHGGATCSGPVVEGLNAGEWTETRFNIPQGMRTVAVAWPPVDGRLLWLADNPPSLESLGPIADRPDFALPDECRDASTITDRRILTSFANSNPDRTGGVWLGDGISKAVMAVVEEHVEQVRTELSTPEAEPCVVPVEYSTTQLHAAYDRLHFELFQPEYSPIMGFGSSEVNNRVHVRVDVADRNTAQFVADLVDEPGLLQITGTGEILDGARAPMDPALVKRSETPMPEGLRPATTLPPAP
ncbi:MAG: hypothetical protein ACRBK7_12900 [Acidimicrobiales bacterium]